MALTSGSVCRILNGDDVSKVIVQVLHYDREDESVYKILISDGYISSYVLLNEKFNSLITNGKLDIFSIIQINKCLWNDDETFITLQDIKVLIQAPLIGHTVGNPTYTSAKSRDAAKEKATDPNSTDISHTARDISKASNSNISFLTSGSVSRIVNGDDVSEAIVQVLDYERDDGSRHEILISDGDFSSHVFLNKQFNSEELETFTIIQVNKFITVYDNEEPFTVLQDIKVLMQNSLIIGLVGYPIYTLPKSRDACKETTTDSNSTAISPTARVTCKISNSIVPLLTSGSVSRIVNGDDVPKAIVQVLGYATEDESVYKIVISDGDFCSHVFLNKQLNSLITNKELDIFTIIQVNKCVWDYDNEIFMTLMDITVFIHASLVRRTLGNPIYTDAKSRDANKITATDPNGTDISQIAGDTSEATNSITLPKLTTGSIRRIYNGDNVPEPVVQVLNCKRVSGTDNDWYQIFLYDGYHKDPFAKLDTKLNSLVENKALERFAIIRVDKYDCNQESGSRVIHLLDITILISGSDVGKILKLF